MKDLSIIIVSYNTSRMTQECLASLKNTLKKSSSISVEIIVVDNASSDDSIDALTKMGNEIIFIKNGANLGFGKANNIGVAASQGRYILFLNSDVLMKNIDFGKLVAILDADPKIGALTVQIVLPNGKYDKAAHRGFPTIWNSFTYFSKLEHLFGQLPHLSKMFGGYHLTHRNLHQVHEIDSPSGAFYLTRKDILNKIGSFDEAFFMYGEDLDLSYRIKKSGYKILYYPHFSVVHLKGQSGMKKEQHTVVQTTKHHFYDAMKIFYDKHYASKHHSFQNKLVHFVINLKQKKL